MSNLEYIMGEKHQKEAMLKEKADHDKDFKLQQVRERKQKEQSDKQEQLEEMKFHLIGKERQKKLYQGLFGTAMFAIFTAMHMNLSIDQYDVQNMNQFNTAVASSLIP